MRSVYDLRAALATKQEQQLFTSTAFSDGVSKCRLQLGPHPDFQHVVNVDLFESRP